MLACVAMCVGALLRPFRHLQIQFSHPKLSACCVVAVGDQSGHLIPPIFLPPSTIKNGHNMIGKILILHHHHRPRRLANLVTSGSLRILRHRRPRRQLIIAHFIILRRHIPQIRILNLMLHGQNKLDLSIGLFIWLSESLLTTHPIQLQVLYLIPILYRYLQTAFDRLLVQVVQHLFIEIQNNVDAAAGVVRRTCRIAIYHQAATGS